LIVDCHTHVMWYPDHLSEQFAQEALASKLVKSQQSGGQVHAAHLDLHSYDSRPDEHWAAAQSADKVGWSSACRRAPPASGCPTK
jgi:uncharacterized protein